MNDAGKRGSNTRSKILTKIRTSRTLFTRTIKTIRKQSLLKYTKEREVVTSKLVTKARFEANDVQKALVIESVHIQLCL